MPRLPLEDDCSDIIKKAQRGLQMSDAQLAKGADITLEDLNSLKSGRILEPAILAVARALRLNPDSLLGIARRELYPPLPAFEHSFTMFNTLDGDMAVNNYLLWDPRSRQAAVFDTGGDCQSLLDTLSADKLQLVYIFITHTHEDHIAALGKLTQAHPRAAIWSSELEPVNHPQAKTFREGSQFHLGELSIRTLLTNGHSAGLTTYFIKGLSWPLAIVGDALFACSMGGSAEHYSRQLKNNWEKIFTLPRNTVIAPGHGPLTSLAFEKQHNPFFSSRGASVSAKKTQFGAV